MEEYSAIWVGHLGKNKKALDSQHIVPKIVAIYFRVINIIYKASLELLHTGHFLVTCLYFTAYLQMVSGCELFIFQKRIQ